jgi:hypothetical protein
VRPARRDSINGKLRNNPASPMTAFREFALALDTDGCASKKRIHRIPINRSAAAW